MREITLQKFNKSITIYFIINRKNLIKLDIANILYN